MATLPTLTLGTFTNVAGATIVGTEPVLQVIASAVDTSYVYSGNNNSTGTYSANFALADTPTDFGNMDTLAVRLRYLVSGTALNTCSLTVQVFQSDGTTALTDAVQVIANVNNTAAENSTVVTLTGLNTTADKAVWDGALVRINWGLTKVKGGETFERRVTAAEVTGTYSIAPISGLLTLNHSLTDTASSFAILSSLLNLSKSVSDTTFKNIFTIVLLDLLNNYDIETILTPILATMQITGNYSLSTAGLAIYNALAEIGIDLTVEGLSSLSAVYINTSASDVGRVNHPVVSWSDTSIELAAISKSGLTGDTFYFKVADNSGVESNWYGPVSIIDDGALNETISLVYSTNTDNVSSVIFNTIIALSSTLSVEDLGTLISSVVINLSSNLDISIINNIITNVILSLNKELSQDNLTTLTNVVLLNLSKNLSIDSTNTIITSVLISLSSTLSVEDLGTLISSVVINLSSNLDISVINNIITNVILSLNKELSQANLIDLTNVVLLNLSKNLSIDSTNTIITSVLVSLSNILTQENLGAAIKSVVMNLSNHLDIDVVNNILITVILELQNTTSIDILINTFISTFITINKGYTLESTSARLLYVFSELTSNYDSAKASNLFISKILELSSQLSVNQATHAILNAVYTLHKDVSTFIPSEIFGNIALNLASSYGISTSLIAILNNLITLDIVLDVESLNIVTTTVFANLDIEITDVLIYSAIINKTLDLALNIDINAVSEALSVIFALLDIDSEYHVSNINSIVTAAILFLQNSLDIDTIRTIITTSLSTISINLDATAFSRAVKTLAISLSNHYSIDIAISTAIIAYLSLTSTTDLDLLREYIGLATAELVEAFTIEQAVIGILNSSVGIDKHISIISQELSGLLTSIELGANYNLVHNVIAEYIITFIVEKALLLDTSRTVEYTGSFELNTILDVGNIQRGLNTLGILNTSFNVSSIILSTKSTSALLSVLQQLFVDSDNSNNIFNSAISIGKILDSETYNRLDALSSLEIDLNSELFATFTSDLNNLITLTQGLSTINVATLNVTGVLELTNNTVLQLQKFGIINADIDVVTAISMALVKKLVTEANISINQVLTIPTGFGFDLLITTPDNRVYIIKFDNRELKVVYEDRTNKILKDNRNNTE